MKNFSLTIIALFLASCSDGDRFNYNSKQELELDFFSEIYYRNEPYIRAYPYLLEEEGEEYSCYWAIDGERFYGQYLDRKISYGEHVLEFVLMDGFGDTLSVSGVIRVNEPLKIALLSPVEKYEAAKTDTIVFQYKISGIDTWEKEPRAAVYISVDKNEWIPLRSNLLAPPLNDSVYYWRIRADTVFSEIRSVWIKN